jgi:hypothetical protein
MKTVPIFEELIEEKPQNFIDPVGKPCKCEKEDII